MQVDLSDPKTGWKQSSVYVPRRDTRAWDVPAKEERRSRYYGAALLAVMGSLMIILALFLN